jgi:hypothetical protein
LINLNAKNKVWKAKAEDKTHVETLATRTLLIYRETKYPKALRR